jgi:drug/metabolite transporter (DMT)-like permease
MILISLSNAHTHTHTRSPIIMAVYLHLSGRCRLSYVEWAGVFIAFVGMGLSSVSPLDTHAGHPAGHTHTHTHTSPGEGDIPPSLVAVSICMCLLSAVVYVLDTFIAKRVRAQVPILMYGCTVSLVIAVWAAVGSALFEGGVHFTAGRDGLLGWASSGDLFWELFSFALVVGMFTISGYNYAVLHVSPLLFSMAKLTDPFLTGVASWCTGLEGVPPLLGATLSCVYALDCC